jgi:hypothetical protein
MLAVLAVYRAARPPVTGVVAAHAARAVQPGRPCYSIAVPAGDREAGFAGLERDRGFADSPLEQDGFEPSVPLAKVSAPAAEGEMPKRSKGTAS